MRAIHVSLLCLVCVACTANLSIAGVVYTQDFESGVLGPEWGASQSIQSTEGLSAFGFGSWHLKSDTSLANVLTMTGLDPHSTITLTFDLAMWDSLDLGSDSLSLDEATVGQVLFETFGNYYPSSGSEGPGTPLTPPTNGDFDNPQYGYNLGFRDSARHVSFTFAHTASVLSLSFSFPGTQGAPDEAFGIDNVRVETDAVAAVPEPASAALFGLGALGLAMRAGRRRATVGNSSISG